MRLHAEALENDTRPPWRPKAMALLARWAPAELAVSVQGIAHPRSRDGVGFLPPPHELMALVTTLHLQALRVSCLDLCSLQVTTLTPPHTHHESRAGSPAPTQAPALSPPPPTLSPQGCTRLRVLSFGECQFTDWLGVGAPSKRHHHAAGGAAAGPLVPQLQPLPQLATLSVRGAALSSGACRNALQAVLQLCAHATELSASGDGGQLLQSSFLLPRLRAVDAGGDLTDEVAVALLQHPTVAVLRATHLARMAIDYSRVAPGVTRWRALLVTEEASVGQLLRMPLAALEMVQLGGVLDLESATVGQLQWLLQQACPKLQAEMGCPLSPFDPNSGFTVRAQRPDPAGAAQLVEALLRRPLNRGTTGGAVTVPHTLSLELQESGGGDGAMALLRGLVPRLGGTAVRRLQVKVSPEASLAGLLDLVPPSVTHVQVRQGHLWGSGALPSLLRAVAGVCTPHQKRPP